MTIQTPEASTWRPARVSMAGASQWRSELIELPKLGICWEPRGEGC
jgi:hypothetical protein